MSEFDKAEGWRKVSPRRLKRLGIETDGYFEALWSSHICAIPAQKVFFTSHQLHVLALVAKKKERVVYIRPMRVSCRGSGNAHQRRLKRRSA